jgi:uncharacterized repeat protein (TIGR01451 family)
MPDSVYAYTDTAGVFKFHVYSGNYTVQYFPYNNWQVTTDSLSYTITVSGISLTGFDFGSNFINSQNHVAGYLSAAHPRCSQIVPLVQHYQNIGTNFLDGEIKMIIDTAVSYVSSTPLPAAISGDTIWWNFVDLAPYERGEINVLIQIPGPAYSGTFIQTSSVVSYDSSSVLIPSDYDTVTQTILCSFDPNDKNVSPQGIGLNHLTLMNTTLEYTIRFQNTGTDTAYKVTIFDTLDASLDVNTFEFTSSSHAGQVLLNANGILKFIFNTIHLPDSNINEPGSHGFVSFRILAKAGLPDWTTVNNKATIFFDFLDGVTTNTVFNTLVYNITGIYETALQNAELLLYPNPFTTSLTLKGTTQKGELIIFDITGKEILRTVTFSAETKITTAHLTAGFYFVNYREGNKTVNKKVVKLN